LAPPAITRAFSRDRLSALTAPPSAQGREHLGLGVVDVVGRDDLSAGLVGDLAQRVLVDVRDDQLRARCMQLVRQDRAHVADALDGDRQTTDVLRAQAVAYGRLDPAEDPFRRNRAGIA
jgi:hypothetical protein